MTSRLQSSGIAALSFTLSASVLALALTPAMAQAATTTEPFEAIARGDRVVETRRVDASDLDLNSRSDMRTLTSRINRAIYEVCREPNDSRLNMENVKCSNEARQSADQQVAALRSSTTLLAAANGATAPRTITIVAAR